jgi:hypothetical protein
VRLKCFCIKSSKCSLEDFMLKSPATMRGISVSNRHLSRIVASEQAYNINDFIRSVSASDCDTL